MRRTPLLLFPLILTACGDGSPAPQSPPPITLHAASNVAAGVGMALDDVAADLARISGLRAVRSTAPAPSTCRPGEVHVQVRPRAPSEAPLEPQTFTIDESRCASDGRLVTVRGADDVATQWALYDLVERLGVRYFHPEQTYYPARWSWPSQPLAVRARPAFRERSIHLHRTHPVELLPPLDTTGLDMAAHQRRWIAWNVKLRQTALDGWDAAHVVRYPWDRGFPRHAGMNLLNSQQGSTGVLNPDDPRPEEEQLRAAIAERMAPRQNEPPVTQFDFQFNPSEFTEADDRDTVRRMTFIAEHMARSHPGVKLRTINHGTAGMPTSHYRVRFYDLPQFAPANLGVKVHTLMFYDLERPANVYGNETFQPMLEWMRREAARREIVHYPEASWWLSFDLPVPLYLAPVTLEARQHDIDLLRPLVTADATATRGVVGHHIFSSGQEWGYWLIDWCVARMTWDLAYTHARCLDDFTGVLARGDEVRAVLREVEARQVRDMRDPELVRYLVGSDDATETAARAGIVFHPLPPTPEEVLGWTDAQAAMTETRSLAPLRAMAADYHRLADRVEAVLPMQDARQAPWVREVRDGLRIFALRAEHAVAVYETTLRVRAAARAGDAMAVEAAREGLMRATAITDRARTVVRAREMDYRYPAALSTAGDEPGTPGAVPNGTVYPYRVLSRTHRLFYWTRPDQQLAELFRAGLDPVRVERRMFTEGQSLSPSLLLAGVSDVRIDWGDGMTSTMLMPHRYTAQGVYAWTLRATHARGTVEWTDQAAQVARRIVFPKGSLRIAEPMGAALLNSSLPGFEAGVGRDMMGDFLALGRIDGAANVSARGSLTRRPREGNASGPADLPISVRGVGDITVLGARMELGDGMGPNDRRLTITGQLSTQRVIDLLVGVGGFNQEGARRLVASILGFSPMTLPERVSFRIEGTGREEP